MLQLMNAGAAVKALADQLAADKNASAPPAPGERPSEDTWGIDLIDPRQTPQGLDINVTSATTYVWDFRQTARHYSVHGQLYNAGVDEVTARLYPVAGGAPITRPLLPGVAYTWDTYYVSRIELTGTTASATRVLGEAQ